MVSISILPKIGIIMFISLAIGLRSLGVGGGLSPNMQCGYPLAAEVERGEGVAGNIGNKTWGFSNIFVRGTWTYAKAGTGFLLQVRVNNPPFEPSSATFPSDIKVIGVETVNTAGADFMLITEEVSNNILLFKSTAGNIVSVTAPSISGTAIKGHGCYASKDVAGTTVRAGAAVGSSNISMITPYDNTLMPFGALRAYDPVTSEWMFFLVGKDVSVTGQYEFSKVLGSGIPDLQEGDDLSMCRTIENGQVVLAVGRQEDTTTYTIRVFSCKVGEADWKLTDTFQHKGAGRLVDEIPYTVLTYLIQIKDVNGTGIFGNYLCDTTEGFKPYRSLGYVEIL